MRIDFTESPVGLPGPDAFSLPHVKTTLCPVCGHVALPESQASGDVYYYHKAEIRERGGYGDTSPTLVRVTQSCVWPASRKGRALWLLRTCAMRMSAIPSQIEAARGLLAEDMEEVGAQQATVAEMLVRVEENLSQTREVLQAVRAHYLSALLPTGTGEDVAGPPS